MDRPVTLVTGSSRGIGRFLAEKLIEEGHQVIGCSRSETTLRDDNYIHFPCDVTDEGQVIGVFRGLRKRVGKLNNLINNAGVAALNHSLLTPGSVVRRLLDINVLGTFLFSREASKIMKGIGGGRIVNFSTVAVPLRVEGEAAYAASKGAVKTLTEVLSKELAPFQITVNSIGPTPIDTDLIRSVPKDKIQKLIEAQAIKRSGTFEDVWNVIEFYLRPGSNFITGQTLYLGGV